jgi:HSP20 family protein
MTRRASKSDPSFPRIRNVDRFMQRFMHGTLFRLSPREPWQPAVDVYELEAEIHVVVDLAGVDRERVEVILEGDRLSVRGWRGDPAPRKRVRLHQIEIDHGLFERTVRIETVVDRDRLEAVYRDGFLRVRLPKARDQERREVEIKELDGKTEDG